VGTGTRVARPVRPAGLAGKQGIYVQIPAYRDSELETTLRDLYSKADHAGRLRTAVLWQRGADESLSADVRSLPNLEIVDVEFSESRGPNWARALLQERWRGEPFTLLLDSHHRFVRGWDTAVVAMYRQLESSGVDKPLLTAYLPSYEPAREPGARKKRPYKIYPLQREQGVLTRLTSYPIPCWTRLNEPVVADFVSLHFLFAEGAFNEAVVFDPDIYFFGDELVIGLRAYLAGYDLFHPHRIVGWHCYDRGSRVGHWEDHSRWAEQHQKSLRKIRRLFLDGRGRRNGERTVSDYEDHIMLPLVVRT
jgi:Glycosyltransferase (GlcNAc)